MSVKYCPLCAAITTVEDSRADSKMYIRRRRKCSKCDFKFTTKEVSAVFLKNMVTRLKTLDKLEAIINNNK